MANYDSNYTGRDVDDSIAFTESFTRTPAEIEATLTRFESIESTPANIDNAVNYLTLLEGELTPSQIRRMYDYFNALTVTSENINDVVTKFNTVNSQPTQIDDTVNKIVNNEASLNEVLVSDGTGGSEWGAISQFIPTPYQNFVKLTLNDGNGYSQLIATYNRISASNSKANFLSYIRNFFNSKNRPFPISGTISNNGTAFRVDGVYYANDAYHAINSDNLTENDIVIDFTNFVYSVTQIPLWIFSN